MLARAMMAKAGYMVYNELASPKEASYQALTAKSAAAAVEKAHESWEMTTVLIAMTLVFAGMAYLLYVKHFQPIPEQERVISGLKGRQ